MKFHLSHLPEVQAAIAAAAACGTLDELADAIHSFDAHPVCTSPAMPGRAGARMTDARPVMILGKSPAGTETETRVPFSGPAGKVLRSEMEAAGFDLETCWITCATPWKARKDNTPNATQLAVSRPFLFREIELVNPSVIVALGQKAHEALFQVSENLGDKPGRTFELEVAGTSYPVAVTTCHAAVMYCPQDLSVPFRRHLGAAFALARPAELETAA